MHIIWVYLGILVLLLVQYVVTEHSMTSLVTYFIYFYLFKQCLKRVTQISLRAILTKPYRIHWAPHNVYVKVFSSHYAEKYVTFITILLISSLTVPVLEMTSQVFAQFSRID